MTTPGSSRPCTTKTPVVAGLERNSNEIPTTMVQPITMAKRVTMAKGVSPNSGPCIRVIVTRRATKDIMSQTDALDCLMLPVYHYCTKCKDTENNWNLQVRRSKRSKSKSCQTSF